MFDRYADNRTLGSFVIIDPATNFTAGAGMIVSAERESTTGAGATAAMRIAQAAREASNTADAEEAVRRLLEEMLT